jgi:hypothetical protein
MLTRAVMGQSTRQGSDEQRFFCNRRGDYYKLRDFHNGDKNSPKKIPAERLDIAAELFDRRPVPPYHVDQKGYGMVMRAKTAHTNSEYPSSVRSIACVDYIVGSGAWNGCMV